MSTKKSDNRLEDYKKKQEKRMNFDSLYKYFICTLSDFFKL